ncbi:MAG: DUF58 domain-containing protein [Myxococcota bacterium]|nr:DUF58 domain-containing protein [Myxococcota bacterium]
MQPALPTSQAASAGQSAVSNVSARKRWLFAISVLLVGVGIALGAPVALGLLALGAVAVFAWRRIRREGGPWQTQRARLTFTRDGKYLVAITIGVGLAAINTGNNLLYLFLGMLLALIVVSGILSEIVLQKLSLSRRLPPNGWAGQTILVGLRVENRKRQIPSYSLLIEDKLSGQGAAQNCYFLKVKARSAQSTHYRLPLMKRGRCTFESSVLSTRFPFGFFVKSRRRRHQDSIIVFPRIRPVDVDGHVSPFEADGDLSRPWAIGREFSHLRDYRDGDDARDIHWKRSAARPDLVTRSYTSDGRLSALVVIETTVPTTENLVDPQFRQEGETCLELAASFIIGLIERNYDVVAQIRQRQYPVTRDEGARHALFTALALTDFTHVNSSEHVVPADLDPGAIVIAHPTARPSIQAVTPARILTEDIFQ